MGERCSLVFADLEGLENNRIIKRVYKGKCMGVRPMSQARKRWINSVNTC